MIDPSPSYLINEGTVYIHHGLALWWCFLASAFRHLRVRD
jgi:hypothetical protein